MTETATKVLVIHGPNLNLLGQREPEVYGHMTLEDVNERLGDYAKGHDATLRIMQSNHEGEIIDAIAMRSAMPSPASRCLRWRYISPMSMPGKPFVTLR
jgi:hypothetical protein